MQHGAVEDRSRAPPPPLRYRFSNWYLFQCIKMTINTFLISARGPARTIANTFVWRAKLIKTSANWSGFSNKIKNGNASRADGGFKKMFLGPLTLIPMQAIPSWVTPSGRRRHPFCIGVNCLHVRSRAEWSHQIYIPCRDSSSRM